MKNDLLQSATTLLHYRQQINQRLEQWLPNTQTVLHNAMRYAVLSGGKRLRPQLVYATGSCFGASITDLDHPAAAVELIHCYSLVHDDLPAMDDDDLRRGQPTCHKAFDEATAILVGDALQSLAFELIASNTNHACSETKIAMIKTLAQAIGSNGMAGGQALDLQAEKHQLTPTDLEQLYDLKTVALIKASVMLGAQAADLSDQTSLFYLEQFASKLGLAFQIQDDILDLEGETAVMGKTQGADLVHQKATYPSIKGPTQAKQQVQEYYAQALDALQKIPYDADMNLLADICHHLQNRQQ